jgi:hypothetical protein
MKRTIIIRRDYLHYIKKYQRCAGGADLRARTLVFARAHTQRTRVLSLTLP